MVVIAIVKDCNETIACLQTGGENILCYTRMKYFGLSFKAECILECDVDVTTQPQMQWLVTQKHNSEMTILYPDQSPDSASGHVFKIARQIALKVMDGFNEILGMNSL